MVTAYIGLGANLGDPAQAVRDAIAQLARLPQTTLVRQSSLYASAPVDAGGDDFVNAVVQLDTGLAPQALLQPHPRMCMRAFVLLPLLELAPEIAVPGRGPARAHLAGVQDQPIARLPEPAAGPQK